MGFWVRSKLIGSLSGKQKAANEASEGWHGRAAGGTGRAMSLTWGVTYFCIESSYFHPELAQNPFLLLQDSFFRIFVPEI